jgi:CBS domain-containing protein
MGSGAPRPVLHLSLVVPGQLRERARRQRLGEVEDLIVRLGADTYPPITGLLVSVAHRRAYVPAERVADVEVGGVALGSPQLDLREFARRSDEVLLRKDVLDHQLINVDGARLVRANDIALARVEGWYRVVGVDTSVRALARRLLPRRLGARLGGGAVLDWAGVEPFVGHVPSVRLRVPHPKLARLHPAQIADLVEAASHGEGEEIMAAAGADKELEADVYEELDARHQREFLLERPDAEVAAVLARMETDDAADLVAELPTDRREPVLELLPSVSRRRVRALLGYDPATAGGLMSPEFVCLDQHATVAEALERVRRSRAPVEALATVYVMDARHRLRTALPLVELLRAEPAMPLLDLLGGPPMAVEPTSELEEVARLMADFDLTTVPVVDEEQRMLGIVTVDDVLELVLPRGWRRRFGVLGGE